MFQILFIVSQAGCLWSGSRLPVFICFRCLPLPFICLPGLVLVVARLLSHFLSFLSHFSQPRCFCFPLPLICLPLLFICLPGWVLVVARLVSHFLSFVSHFFSQAGCLWSGPRLACLPLPCICFPFPYICTTSFLFPHLICVSASVLLFSTSFDLSPTSFHLSPRLGACGRPACLPLPFICLPLLFPGWVLVVRSPPGLSPTSLHLFPISLHLRNFFFVSTFVFQPRCFCFPLPLICLPLLFICLPGWVLVVGCLRIFVFVSHFLSCVSHAGCSLHLSPTSQQEIKANKAVNPGLEGLANSYVILPDGSLCYTFQDFPVITQQGATFMAPIRVNVRECTASFAKKGASRKLSVSSMMTWRRHEDEQLLVFHELQRLPIDLVDPVDSSHLALPAREPCTPLPSPTTVRPTTAFPYVDDFETRPSHDEAAV